MKKQNESCISRDLVKAAETALQKLKKEGLTIITAESCTAGLIATALSYAEGASDILHGSFVTYTKEHKQKALGVSKTLLRQKGSVHPEVAQAMAEGALKKSPADVAIAVTGVLGPAPDEDGAPVGLIYFAVQRRGKKPKLHKEFFPKTEHNAMRLKAVKIALKLIDKVTG